METIYIGFTGNRYGLSVEQKTLIVEIFDNYNDKDIVVLHGDCIGSDADFNDICIKYKKIYPMKNFKIHIYPPTNDKLRAFCAGDFIANPKQYLERNKNIVLNSNVLIGCPIDKNKPILRSGTWSTIRLAKKHNKQLLLL